MYYTITIEKVESVYQEEQGPWTIIGRRPLTNEEFDKACGPIKMGREEGGDSLMKDVYGYAPPRQVRVKDKKVIYEQCVDELDLVNVIAAVNGVALAGAL